MTDRKTLEIEIVPLADAVRFWELAGDDENDLTDGEALDAILTFAAVDGEEITDGEVLERIEDVIATWRSRNR